MRKKKGRIRSFEYMKQLGASRITLNINLDSEEKVDFLLGDIYTLDRFIENCEAGGFVDYDGNVGEVLLRDNIIINQDLYPSDILLKKQELLDLQSKVGELKVIWYNK